MPQLPPEWADHLETGVSHRLGGCHADGRPEICRGLASWSRPDGRIEVVLNLRNGRELLAAVLANRRLAYVASQPDTNRTLHVKATDAEAIAVEPFHMDLMLRTCERFAARVMPFGFSRDDIIGAWFEHGIDELAALRFTPDGAWDQSPGPGAGQAIELLR